MLVLDNHINDIFNGRRKYLSRPESICHILSHLPLALWKKKLHEQYLYIYAFRKELMHYFHNECDEGKKTNKDKELYLVGVTHPRAHTIPFIIVPADKKLFNESVYSV